MTNKKINLSKLDNKNNYIYSSNLLDLYDFGANTKYVFIDFYALECDFFENLNNIVNSLSDMTFVIRSSITREIYKMYKLKKNRDNNEIIKNIRIDLNADDYLGCEHYLTDYRHFIILGYATDSALYYVDNNDINFQNLLKEL